MKKIIIIASSILGLSLSIGIYFLFSKSLSKDQPEKIVKTNNINSSKFNYINLDKIILMVKNSSSNFSNVNHYLSLDLAIRTDDKHSKKVKTDLPMLKSLAVKYLSEINFEELKNINIQELSEKLQEELLLNYTNQNNISPFDKIMISRFIVE